MELLRYIGNSRVISPTFFSPSPAFILALLCKLCQAELCSIRWLLVMIGRCQVSPETSFVFFKLIESKSSALMAMSSKSNMLLRPSSEVTSLRLFPPDEMLKSLTGTCAVGVKGKDIVVLGCEKRSAMKLQDTRITPSKIGLIDTHVCLAFAGLNADARILVDKARLEAQSHRLTVEDPVTIEYITKYVAGVQQKYTQSGGVRPFGISTLIVGFDKGDETPRLYQTEPSGIYSAW